MSKPIRYIFIPEIGSTAESTLALNDLRLKSAWETIKTMLKQHLGENPEHVAVLHEGQRRDMFVGETSAINGKHIRNVRATEIYRNNWLTQHPGTDPESLPAVSGPAVLFPDTIVWK